VQHPEPRDEIQAQFSLPHAVTAALLDGRVVPATFSMARIEAPEFKSFRPKVKMVVREDWGWTPTGWTPRITYRLKGGKEIVSEPKHSKGQPPELLSFDACIEKYRWCVDGIVAEENIVRSIDMLRKLETIPDVGALMRTVAVVG
jgi:2-methylcitrate dehydratase PrpD